MSALNDEDLRYTFSCPSCGGSFSISLAKIPPVQARFSCPKCSKAMDFPSRDEARVFLSLQGSSGEAPAAPAPPPPPARPSIPEPRPAPVERAAAPPPPPAPAAPPPRPAAPSPEAMESTGAASSKTYTVERKGFEGDEFDRRSMRNLIRSALVNESDLIKVDGAVPVRADSLPELKSLFELRKTARSTPPPVCPKHTDQLAHYQCTDTGRPLCEECSEEKKFGGASVRVCRHCGGTAGELHAAPEDLG